jgi:flagellar basal-body rod protein FlgF/flagellar basal-body rod protein FlgG
LYISADGARVQARRLETIANNLANVDTVGFKRDVALFQARYAEAIERGQDYPGSGSAANAGGGVMLHHTATDFSGGTLRRTEVPTDVAIRGDGFFLVRADGEELLTRAGNFALTPRGELQTQDGAAVLGEGRAPIVLDPEAPWSVTPEGGVAQEGSVVNLALVAPASPGDLVKVGENRFRALAPLRPVPAAQRAVAAGHLEMSGVNPATTLMELIEASRALEANVSLIKSQDEMLSGLVNRVLRSG